MASPSSGVPRGAITAFLSQIPPLSVTYGAILIGSMFGFILYGLILHQSYRYFRIYTTDPLYIRLMVILVLLLETTHVAVTAHICFSHLVSAYFNPLSLLVGGWSLDILPFLSSITIIVSQIFSIRRVSLIGPMQSFLAWVVSLLLLGELGFGLAASIKAFIFVDVRVLKTATYLSAAGLGMVCVADTVLTVALVLAIRKSRVGYDRRKTGDSESIFDLVQLYLINTGALTDVIDWIAFICAVARPTYLLLAALTIVASRLYGTTLLSVLNSRQLRGMELFAGASMAISIARAKREASKDLWNTPKLPDATPAKIDIEVTTEMEGEN
ncbi:hypothetical protein BD311DRAFT_765070 [Dichomitus squalens]|uniref:DUF6534 domain-containing protein n=1 Tax=Dichomitus squalens TaxID=114155 RepID=A0A4Q9MD02_9APHY|nr:hypothetical protein BD311DRAFT_765070 [Dichomitus squalens]